MNPSHLYHLTLFYFACAILYIFLISIDLLVLFGYMCFYYLMFCFYISAWNYEIMSWISTSYHIIIDSKLRSYLKICFLSNFFGYYLFFNEYLLCLNWHCFQFFILMVLHIFFLSFVMILLSLAFDFFLMKKDDI